MLNTNYVIETVLSTLQGLIQLIYTTPYDVDIIITSILLMETLRPREIQKEALIIKCWNLDLSVDSSYIHCRFPKRY